MITKIRPDSGSTLYWICYSEFFSDDACIDGLLPGLWFNGAVEAILQGTLVQTAVLALVTLAGGEIFCTHSFRPSLTSGLGLSKFCSEWYSPRDNGGLSTGKCVPALSARSS